SVEGYAPVITAAITELLTRWGKLPEGSVIDAHRVMSALTLEIISQAVFAADSREMVDIIERSSTEYQIKMTFSFCSAVPALNRSWESYKIGQGRRIVRELDQAIYQLIARRLRDSGEKSNADLLGRLIAARDTETGAGLSSEGVRDQVVTIMMAGHETTA